MKYTLIALCVFVLSPYVYSQEVRANAFDHYRAGQCDKAIPILEKALTADKSDYTARIYLGGCYLKLERKEEARKTLAKIAKQTDVLSDGLDVKLSNDKKDRGRFAEYTHLARSNGTTGTVLLAIEVKADGTVGMVVVVKSLPYGLTESSIAAARRTKWIPAMKGGKNVDAMTIREYTFSIY